MISGGGLPRAEHSTTAPVVLEKSTRFKGSLRKMGPAVSSAAWAGPKRAAAIKVSRWSATRLDMLRAGLTRPQHAGVWNKEKIVVLGATANVLRVKRSSSCRVDEKRDKYFFM